MKKAEIGELICKFLSIYAFIGALGALQMPVTMHQPGMRGHGSTLFSIASFIPAVLLFLFSALLWLSARQSEASSDPSQESSECASGITPHVLQSIAFTVVGIGILLDTLHYPGQIIIRCFNGIPVGDPTFWLDLAVALIRLALGSWLVIGSAGMRKFKSWLLENMSAAVRKDW